MHYVIEDFDLSYIPGGRGKRGLTDSETYSNLKYSILQHIMRAASGVRYQPYLRNEILRPAGLMEIVIGRGPESERRDGEATYYDQPFAPLRTSQYPQDADPVPRP